MIEYFPLFDLVSLISIDNFLNLITGQVCNVHASTQLVIKYGLLLCNMIKRQLQRYYLQI